jgi:hypothetical protein
MLIAQGTRLIYRVCNYSLPGFILRMPTSQKEVLILAVGSLAASTTSNQLDEPLVRLERDLSEMPLSVGCKRTGHSKSNDKYSQYYYCWMRTAREFLMVSFQSRRMGISGRAVLQVHE